jgi:hypothetical protein
MSRHYLRRAIFGAIFGIFDIVYLALFQNIIPGSIGLKNHVSLKETVFSPPQITNFTEGLYEIQYTLGVYYDGKKVISDIPPVLQCYTEINQCVADALFELSQI